MQNTFHTAMFGYNKKQVDTYIARLVREQEDALALRNDRFVEIRDKYNIMCNELADYRRKEQEISAALIKAHAMAADIVREGEKDAANEKVRLSEEIRQLDRVAHMLYSRIESAILLSRETVQGFEQDLNDLLSRKETFLKSTYGFEKENNTETEWKIKV